MKKDYNDLKAVSRLKENVIKDKIIFGYRQAINNKKRKHPKGLEFLELQDKNI